MLGIVENFSYLKCPDCGRKIEVFGKSRIGEIAKELDIPVLGRIPIDPKLTEAVDGEAFDQVKNVYLDDAAKVLEDVYKRQVLESSQKGDGAIC